MDGDVRRPDGAAVRLVRVAFVVCRSRQRQLLKERRSHARRLRDGRQGDAHDFVAEHSAGRTRARLGPVPDPGSDQPDGRNRPVRPAHEGEKKLSLAV